ncbi:hypothetical protein NL108_007833 [Boleophthalmus pectinirostris]|uniref:methylmalonic aciduria and homocystinuria type D homolog, mitochondrial-like n=1 Tax=Boleophthalmus pectinirostris TaxID=150288 RepID=UPI0024313043|nr:methylmalonic aciduria and homocystinuria type D homolog, mitochondrial-like [Boleophthalmus pectinirostris]KAJ0061105.1 hypothetical protein NL108_007833 [Boleophthalmus pectinirostris]
MTSVCGSRLVLYVSGLKSLLHRVTSARTISATANTVQRSVRSRDAAPVAAPAAAPVAAPVAAPCRSTDPVLLLTPMDQHLHALTTAPPGDHSTPRQLCAEESSRGREEDDRFFDSVSVECAVQPCPQRLITDVRLMFPEAPPAVAVTVVTVAQRSVLDMTRWDARVEQERDELLSRFITGAKQICTELHREGHWADFIDPSSGLPFYGPYTNLTLFETDERYSALGFRVEDLGCCRVLRHPLWGTNVFVGTIFTAAPPQDSRVMNVLQGREPPTSRE